jgi:acyl-CoA synthetase (AMP-forming)/AMP-acid ligase II
LLRSDNIEGGTIALYAPGRAPLTHSALRSHVTGTAATLRRLGILRDDAAAVVLPNGPEMATAFLSVSAAAVCAPLNPSYRAAEFEFYFADLPAKALLIGGLEDSPAREVARLAGIRVIEIEWSPDDPAGIFRIIGEDAIEQAELAGDPQPDDVALVLHTSGTTSRPKIVPLTHANLAASARHIGATLELTSSDVCLNVMPLFHIHGLVAALLASLNAGASVVCSPGFIAPKFFDWMAEFRPTWYTGVPTMHASILSRAGANRAVVDSHNLRFIRSSSAALPSSTFRLLEETFRVPVIEAYGMTEAAHQLASNPLPPGTRKAGSVGRQAGPAIAILDSEGNELPPGTRGEVSIKGRNVMKGYARNEAANASAFANGWLRTGDEGLFDEDGYLAILGRLKEVINRGGEKISPLEVEEAMLAHPAVAQAVVFAARDAILGEEVAAAVVLCPGHVVSERQLREYLGVTLAYFKVPKRIVFMSEIPTGPTGKMQRIGLGDRLGVAFDGPPQSPDEYTAPRNSVEEILASIWATVMRTDPPGIHQNFFNAGGDSILAARFIAHVRDSLAIDMSLLTVFDAPTIAELAPIAEELMAVERDA